LTSFFFDEVFGAEITNFAGDAAGETGRIKSGDVGDPVAPGQHCAPALFGADAYRRNQAYACHNYSAPQHGPPIMECKVEPEWFYFFETLASM